MGIFRKNVSPNQFEIPSAVPVLYRCENLPISSSSNRNNMPKIWHYNAVYLLRYRHLGFIKLIDTSVHTLSRHTTRNS